MSLERPLVLVVGGTGNFGIPILKDLAKTASGKWRLAASVRPHSMDKPQVSTLRDLGVEIRQSDWQKEGPEQLDKLLSGVEVLISTVNAEAILDQKALVDAAKRAGVKRFIPCDFGTACIPGVRDLYDEKLEVRKYLEDSSVPYTFIDVGYLMRIIVPYRKSDESRIAKLVREFYGDGNKKNAIVDSRSIGAFVSCIIADPRTLNQYVFIYDEELTVNEIYQIAGDIAGEDFQKNKIAVSEEEVLKRAADAKEEYQKGPSFWSHALWSWYQYMHSMHFGGYNTVEVARSQGALDGKELYPDIAYSSVAEYAEILYGGKLEA